jgi:hypothetical protein
MATETTLNDARTRRKMMNFVDTDADDAQRRSALQAINMWTMKETRKMPTEI